MSDSSDLSNFKHIQSTNTARAVSTTTTPMGLSKNSTVDIDALANAFQLDDAGLASVLESATQPTATSMSSSAAASASSSSCSASACLSPMASNGFNELFGHSDFYNNFIPAQPFNSNKRNEISSGFLARDFNTTEVMTPRHLDANFDLDSMTRQLTEMSFRMDTLTENVLKQLDTPKFDAIDAYDDYMEQHHKALQRLAWNLDEHNNDKNDDNNHNNNCLYPNQQCETMPVPNGNEFACSQMNKTDSLSTMGVASPLGFIGNNNNDDNYDGNNIINNEVVGINQDRFNTQHQFYQQQYLQHPPSLTRSSTMRGRRTTKAEGFKVHTLDSQKHVTSHLLQQPIHTYHQQHQHQQPQQHGVKIYPKKKHPLASGADGMPLQGTNAANGNMISPPILGNMPTSTTWVPLPNWPCKERFTIAQIQGNVEAIAKDQAGCRMLQRQLESNDAALISCVVEEVCKSIVELMMDPFGNYLCQKLMTVANSSQVSKIIKAAGDDLVQVGLNMHGTRAVQKLIEVLSCQQHVYQVTKALVPGVVSLVNDLNGNHVIQKCLAVFSSENCEFIYRAMNENCVSLATHRHGCCVMQRCIDAANARQRKELVDSIIEHTLTLVQDAYGNYVVQYVLKLRVPQINLKIVSAMAEQATDLARQKFSSNVVERCLIYCCPEIKNILVDKFVQAPGHVLKDLVLDPYGNYVIQRVLNVSQGQQTAIMLDKIQVHLEEIKVASSGKRIAAKITRRHLNQLNANNNYNQNQNNVDVTNGNGSTNVNVANCNGNACGTNVGAVYATTTDDEEDDVDDDGEVDRDDVEDDDDEGDGDARSGGNYTFDSSDETRRLRQQRPTGASKVSKGNTYKISRDYKHVYNSIPVAGEAVHPRSDGKLPSVKDLKAATTSRVKYVPAYASISAMAAANSAAAKVSATSTRRSNKGTILPPLVSKVHQEAGCVWLE